GVRDWSLSAPDTAFVPYDTAQSLVPLDTASSWYRWQWPCRAALEGIVSFGGNTQKDLGVPWWGWYRWIGERYVTPLTITFGEVATHNHFVLDRGGKVFKQTAPVIKLPAGASEDEHLSLLGLLNASVACFWLKQVCFPKGGDQVGGEGARVRKTLWDERYAFNATNVAEFPLTSGRPVALAHALDTLAREITSLLPAALLVAADTGTRAPPTRADLDAARHQVESLRRRQIALQEALD